MTGEEAVADALESLRLDTICPDVPMKISVNNQLALAACALDQIPGYGIQAGVDSTRAATIFRKRIQTTGNLILTGQASYVCLNRRSNNPGLVMADSDNMRTPLPWLDHHVLQLRFHRAA